MTKNKFATSFSIFLVSTKSDQRVRLLRSRRFFRHQDRQNWLMSYIDVICVIRHQMTHMTSNDAYDINIWLWSIWPILVSKEASGPQQSHLWIRFWLKNCFKIQKLKSGFGIFFLSKFWESFVFLSIMGKTLDGAGKLWKLGKPII